MPASTVRSAIIGSCFIALVIAAVADAASLDPTFGRDGIVTKRFDEAAIGTRVLERPKGKLLVAGGTTSQPLLLRYRAHGRLDRRFGAGGVALIDIPGGFASIATQPDGAIVGAGSYGDVVSGFSFMLSRFHSDGRIDSSFGDLGTVVVPFESSEAWARDVLVLSDGRILGVGQARDPANGSAWSAALVLLHDDGRLDESFGEVGMLWLPTNDEAAVATSAQERADGSIVIGGHIGDSGDVMLAKLAPDRNLDTSFGNEGVVVTRSTTYEEVWALGIDAHNRILIAGNQGLPAARRSSLLVRRYLPDGSLDVSYGADGIAEASLPRGLAARGLAVLPDGSALVAGWVGNEHQAAIARFDPNGELVSTFGDRGIVRLRVRGKTSVWALAARADQSFVIAGHAADRLLVARFRDGAAISRRRGPL